MSTRCYIGKEFEDGSVRYVYCHHTGYPEGVGQILYESYGLDNIDNLLDLGDMSTLGDTPEKSCFYMRDCGETDCEADEALNEDYYFNGYGSDYLDMFIEFKYLLTKDGIWYCFDGEEKVLLKTLLDRGGI